MSTFGEIRSLLHAPPTTSTWHTLCEALERLPANACDPEVAYVQSFLASWPLGVRRRALNPWVERLLCQVYEPRISLCDEILVFEEGGAQDSVELLVCHGGHLRPKSLSISEDLSATAARMLAASSLLEDVQTLSLYAADAPGVHALAASKHLERLERLELEASALDASCLRALLGDSGPPMLRDLDLFDACLGEAEVRALAMSPGAKNLRSLNLSGHNPIGVEGARALANAPLLRGLEVLTVNRKYDGGVGPQGMRALVDSEVLRTEVREALGRWLKEG